MIDIEQLQNLRKMNLTYEKIGEIVGVSRQRVWAILNDYASGNHKGKKIKALYDFLKRTKSCELGLRCLQEKGYVENSYWKLEIHHKDKNRDNDDPANLAVLCVKCHKYMHKKTKLDNIKK